MNQRVPSWNLEEKFSAKSRVTNSFHVSSSSKTLLAQDHESTWLGYDGIAELRWENGQPLTQGLGRDHRTSGTLQSIVDQATVRGKPEPVKVDQVAPWLGHLFESYAAPSSPSMTTTRGDLVPNCNVTNNHNINNDNNISIDNNTNDILNQMGSSSRKMEIVGNCTTRESVTSMGNTSFCCSVSQRETGDEDCRKKRGIEMSSSVPTKKSKAAAAHSQSERKRRDKINQKIRTLQKMIPNSTKTDKASILDEVIEHVGQLQGQVHAMGSKLMSNNVLLQLAIDQQLQLQQHLMGMIGSTTRPAMDSSTTSQHHHLQMSSDDILSAVTARLQSQQQQRAIDLYSILSSSYQQPHHQAGSGPT